MMRLSGASSRKNMAELECFRSLSLSCITDPRGTPAVQSRAIRNTAGFAVPALAGHARSVRKTD
jgi:hypothetical protein